MRAIQWLKSQFFHILPAFIFFYVSFALINFTEGLMMKDAGMQAFGSVAVLLAAAIVAKVLLAIDSLPFLNIFPTRPLIYNVVWKTLLYTLGSLGVRLLNRVWNDYFDDTMLHWREFWAIQIWYLMLFSVFVSARDLTYEIGLKKVRQMFFGK
ncbi:MAG: hypothetical protein JSR58_01425 [Verrucomicrobia bacterium]|nr:hypothetical protein [Verrucomicrobiota bacterium]